MTRTPRSTLFIAGLIVVGAGHRRRKPSAGSCPVRSGSPTTTASSPSRRRPCLPTGAGWSSCVPASSRRRTGGRTSCGSLRPTAPRHHRSSRRPDSRPPHRRSAPTGVSWRSARSPDPRRSGSPDLVPRPGHPEAFPDRRSEGAAGVEPRREVDGVHAAHAAARRSRRRRRPSRIAFSTSGSPGGSSTG